MMCMASTVQGDLEKIEADLDRANELAAEMTGIENAVDLALERVYEQRVAVIRAAYPSTTIGEVAKKYVEKLQARKAAEVQPTEPVIEKKAECDDFMADPYDFSPGDQAWMTGGDGK